MFLLVLVFQTYNKKIKIHVRIHSTVNVIRACIFTMLPVLEVTQRVPPTCITKTDATYVALLWARHQPARLALPANVAQTTVGGAGAVVGTLLRAEDRFCAAVTSPTEFARACIRRVVADTSCVAVARAGAHFRLAHGARVTVFAVARRLATGGGGGGFQQSSRNLGMFGTRQYRPLRFAWYTWYIAIEAFADVVVGL